MSRDKQIEEMAKAICSEYDCVIPCQSCAYYAYANCRDVKSAEKLYNAGYRKASEVAMEVLDEIEKYNRPPLPECEPIYVLRKRELDKLKKKFDCEV